MEPRQSFADYEPLSREPPARTGYCSSCGAALVMDEAQGRHRRTCPACGRIQYRNPLPGTVVLVVDEDRFLLVRRASTTLRTGKWCLPGGAIEWDEDFITAGIRETREEAGVDVAIDGILTATSNFFHENTHTVAIVLLGHVTGGELQSDGVETDGARWFSIKEPLPDLAFDGDRHIIERYFEAPFPGVPVDPRLSH